eukprot:393640_1
MMEMALKVLVMNGIQRKASIIILMFSSVCIAVFCIVYNMHIISYTDVLFNISNYGKSEQKQTVETETYYNTSPHNPPHINIPPFINTISNNSSNSCNSSTNMSIESNSPSINYSPANNSISSISNTPIINYINYSPSTNSPSNINTNNYTNYAVANNYNGKIYSVNNCGSIPLPSCQYHGFHNPTKQYQTQATRFKPY